MAGLEWCPGQLPRNTCACAGCCAADPNRPISLDRVSTCPPQVAAARAAHPGLAEQTIHAILTLAAPTLPHPPRRWQLAGQPTWTGRPSWLQQSRCDCYISPSTLHTPPLLRRWQLPGQPTLDWQSFLAKKNAELQRLNGVYMNLLKNSGVDVSCFVGMQRESAPAGSAVQLTRLQLNLLASVGLLGSSTSLQHSHAASIRCFCKSTIIAVHRGARQAGERSCLLNCC